MFIIGFPVFLRESHESDQLAIDGGRSQSLVTDPRLRWMGSLSLTTCHTALIASIFCPDSSTLMSLLLQRTLRFINSFTSCTTWYNSTWIQCKVANQRESPLCYYLEPILSSHLRLDIFLSFCCNTVLEVVTRRNLIRSTVHTWIYYATSQIVIM